MELLSCHDCHGENIAGDKFCRHCGAKLKKEISETMVLTGFIILGLIGLITVF